MQNRQPVQQRTPAAHAANGNFRQAVQTAAAGGLDTLGIQDPEDVALGGITIAMYAEPGGGKTTTAATAIDYFKRPDVVGPHVKTLFLDAEGGLRPIVSRRDFKFKTITTWDQFVKVTDALILSPNLRDVYPVISVDNLTELSEMSMVEVCRQNRVDEPGWPEWRKNSRIVVQRVRKLRDAARLQRCCVIINLWNRDALDDNNNVKRTTVDLNPALQKVFTGAVDIAAFMEVDEDGRRILHLGQNSRVKAKFRQDLLDPTIRGIPLDLYGPRPPGIFSLAPLLATLIGGEPFPVADYAQPPDTKQSRYAARNPLPTDVPGGNATKAIKAPDLEDLVDKA